jgi:hypothetical protein
MEDFLSIRKLFWSKYAVRTTDVESFFNILLYQTLFQFGLRQLKRRFWRILIAGAGERETGTGWRATPVESLWIKPQGAVF